MGVNTMMGDWFARLYDRKEIKGGRILEFGISDLNFPNLNFVVADFSTRMPLDEATSLANGMLDGDKWKPYAIEDYYSSLGFDQYTAIDFLDPRNTIKLDLNYPSTPKDLGVEQFDVVANLGTSEHIFNPGSTFINAHNFTVPGGLIISVLPTMGHINHGFYNIHPMLHIEIAKANNYEIVDILYIDNTTIREKKLNLMKESDSNFRFDFSELPLSYSGSENLETERMDRIHILLNFVRNTVENVSDVSDIGEIDYANCDAMYIAFRKVGESDFVIPTQF